MGLFGRKREDKEPQQAIERLEQRATAALGGNVGAGLGFGGLKDLMSLANEARAESGPMREYAARIQRLGMGGVDATATVRSVAPTTIAALMGGEQVRVELTVQPSGGAPYDASTDQLLMPGQSKELTVGSEVRVKVDPDDPQSVILIVPGSGFTAATAGGGTTVISSGGTVMFGSVRVDGQPAVQITQPGAFPGIGGQLAQPAAPADPDPGEDRIDQLQKLADLHASGVLTDDEFAAAKHKILDS
jgi:hypothetical protein